jgi:ketosteroid isomerase-like protein
MSQENVEIVRRAFAAWNAGDVDAIRELHDPDVIVRPIEGWPGPRPFVGRGAVLRWFEQLREAWDTDAMEPISFIDMGDRVARIRTGDPFITRERKASQSSPNERHSLRVVDEQGVVFAPHLEYDWEMSRYIGDTAFNRVFCEHALVGPKLGANTGLLRADDLTAGESGGEPRASSVAAEAATAGFSSGKIGSSHARASAATGPRAGRPACGSQAEASTAVPFVFGCHCGPASLDGTRVR